MIGNNSAGSRSIVYGKTIDHVRRLERRPRRRQPRPSSARSAPREWDRRAERHDARRRRSTASVRQIVDEQRDEIRRRFPRILRRVSGYNLDVLARPASTRPTAPPRSGLHQLIVGSEGTLAVVTEAELNLVPRPKARGLLVPQFAIAGRGDGCRWPPAWSSSRRPSS